MSTFSTNTPALRRILGASACAAALGGGALGLGPPAGAEPSNETWDIEAYDACMSDMENDAVHCCVASGGDVVDFDKGTCKAPPAEAVSTNQTRAPLRPLPPVVNLPPAVRAP